MKSTTPREPRKVTIIPATPKRAEPGKPANQKLRVAAYCRVSTDSEEQINSYKNQLAYYTEKISSKSEWKFAGIYADEGITGTSMKHREDFKRMLRACREGRIDLILCKSVSRFGRNSVDVLRTIRALRERGIGVMFEKEAVDTRTMNSELILAFHSAFSQSESESISGNVRWGLRKASLSGFWTGTASTPLRTSWPSGRSPAPRGRRLGAPQLCVPCSPMRSTKATPSSKRPTGPACSPTGPCRTTATCPNIMWRAFCHAS